MYFQTQHNMLETIKLGIPKNKQIGHYKIYNNYSLIDYE